MGNRNRGLQRVIITDSSDIGLKRLIQKSVSTLTIDKQQPNLGKSGFPATRVESTINGMATMIML